jgi:cytochrome P450
MIPHYVYNVFFHPLAKFPGPTLWAASRIPHELAYCQGHIIDKLTALHEKYGEVVRVSPTALSFIHPDAWVDVYTRKQGQRLFSKDSSRYGKMMWVNGAPDIFSADDETVHDRLRRLLIPVFSDKVPGDQEALIQGYVSILITRLRERLHDSSSEGKVDISAWLNWATFDMIGDLAFGEPFGCLQAGEYHPWVALVFDNVKAVSIMSAIKQFPWVDSVMQLLLSGVMTRAIRHHQALTIEKVDRRLEKQTERGDFMDVILAHKGTDKEMTRDEIYANSNLLIMAGSETSAAAMAGLFYYLAKYPEVNGHLKESIRSKFHSEKEITIEAVAELSYLTAVLQETMRIYPPQPVFTPRVAPVGGGTVLGHFLPEHVSDSSFHRSRRKSNQKGADVINPSIRPK